MPTITPTCDKQWETNMWQTPGDYAKASTGPGGQWSKPRSHQSSRRISMAVLDCPTASVRTASCATELQHTIPCLAARRLCPHNPPRHETMRQPSFLLTHETRRCQNYGRCCQISLEHVSQQCIRSYGVAIFLLVSLAWHCGSRLVSCWCFAQKGIGNRHGISLLRDTARCLGGRLVPFKQR